MSLSDMGYDFFSRGWKDDPKETELSIRKQFHSTIDYIVLSSWFMFTM